MPEPSSYIPSNDSSKQTIVVIGAGPAGLVTCKSLIEAATPGEHPFDPIIFEQEDDIGGTFRYRSYEVTISNPTLH